MSLFNLGDAFSAEITLSAGLLMMAICVKKEKNKSALIQVLYFFTFLIALYFNQNYKECIEYKRFFSFSTEIFHLKNLLLGLGLGAGILLSFDKYKEKQEVFMLMIASVIGALLIIQSNHLIIFYLSLELMSFPIYALVALSDHEHSAESSIKYMLQGALITALFLFALSFYYGAGLNSFSFNELSLLNLNVNSSQALMYGSLLGVIFFKLGLVPFHYWVPDVYQQVRPSLIFFLVSVPKIAIIGLLLKLSPILVAYAPFQYLLWVITLLSAGLGSYVALKQSSIQRLLGYASISQIAWIAASFVGGGVDSSVIVYYLIVYAVTMFCCNFILISGFKDIPQIHFTHLKLLTKKNPAMTSLFCLLLISFAGVPPLPGFFAKFYIIYQLLVNHSIILCGLLLLVTGITCAVYLKVILSFFEGDKEDNLASDINTHHGIIEPSNYLLIGSIGAIFLIIAIIPFSFFKFI